MEFYFQLFSLMFGVLALLACAGAIACVKIGYKMGRQTQGYGAPTPEPKCNKHDESIAQDADPWEEAMHRVSKAVSTIPGDERVRQ